MAKYVVNNGLAGTKQNITTTKTAIVGLTAQTTGLTSCDIFHITGSAANIPNAQDCMIEWNVLAITTVGTGTTVTAVKRDSSKGVAATVCTVNHTVAPTGLATLTTSQLLRSVNQKSLMEWVALEPGSEIIVPNTNTNGHALTALSTNYASTVNAEIEFLE